MTMHTARRIITTLADDDQDCGHPAHGHLDAFCDFLCVYGVGEPTVADVAEWCDRDRDSIRTLAAAFDRTAPRGA